MSGQTKHRIVELAPPGAGLPPLQHWFLRFVYMPIYHRLMTVGSARRYFDQQTQNIIDACQNLSPAQLLQPVLIPPMIGLEDSSRNWSVALTLEHLMIVGEGMVDIITKLANGVPPNVKLSTAAVKPKGILSKNAVEAFSDAMKKIQIQIEEGSQNYFLPTMQEHPWFGAMNAKQWHDFLGMHQNLHYKQICAIVKKL